MGEIVGAGIVSHVPTIMLPEETRLEINDGKEITLVPGLRRLRTEVLDRVGADTFVRDGHPLGGDVRAHHHGAREARGDLHLARAAARDAPDPVRHAGRPRARVRRLRSRPRGATTRGCSPPTTRTSRSSTAR